MSFLTDAYGTYTPPPLGRPKFRRHFETEELRPAKAVGTNEDDPLGWYVLAGVTGIAVLIWAVVAE